MMYECQLSLNKPISIVTGQNIKGVLNKNAAADIFYLISKRKALINSDNVVSDNKASDTDGNGKTEINALVLLSSFVAGKPSSFPS